MKNILFYFLIPFFFTYLLVPILKKIGYKRKIFDQPESRKQKNIRMIRIGGASFFIAYMLSTALIFIDSNINNFFSIDPILIKVIFLGSIGYYLIGLTDDLWKVSPFIRLIFQFILGILIWKIGFRIYPPDLQILTFVIKESFILEITSIILTSFWICSVVNAFNWLDGLDGLATGCSIIFLFYFVLIGFQEGNSQLIALCIPLLFSLMAFWKYNFYPSEIFMGDGGSYFIGFCMSILSIVASNASDNNFAIDQISFKSIFLPILILSVPTIDMLKVIIFRIYKRYSPFFPDRGHLHHQILNLGFSEKITVIIIYFLCLIVGKIALWLSGFYL